MKINKITVVDNIISIELDSAAGTISNLYIDTVDNSINKYSVDSDKHDYTIIDYTKSGSTIEIDITKLQPELDLSAFTINIDGIVGFYFDDKEVYYKQVDLLTSYCSACLDNEQKENIVVFKMRYDMLQYAIANNLLEDQINLYIDIARLLKIDTKKNATGLCSGECKRVVSCKGGVCCLC